jgi:hypothetical protein
VPFRDNEIQRLPDGLASSEPEQPGLATTMASAECWMIRS